ncbi:MAG: hypothetical protein F4X64_09980 [Chloroflexi bacterium]|nr:hypothetical protein [Chloroflexota bacterium]
MAHTAFINVTLPPVSSVMAAAGASVGCAGAAGTAVAAGAAVGCSAAAGADSSAGLPHAPAANSRRMAIGTSSNFTPNLRCNIRGSSLPAAIAGVFVIGSLLCGGTLAHRTIVVNNRTHTTVSRVSVSTK